MSLRFELSLCLGLLALWTLPGQAHHPITGKFDPGQRRSLSGITSTSATRSMGARR